MAKVKNAFTMVKLISGAKTGYEKWFQIPRKTGKLNLILYDPRAKRHCLFTESKKRRIQEPPPKDYFRRHRV
ncbi:54S ribosomal protein L39, mitochondrial [[Candida] jaroonii]|uniref:54S ribosomal protein L39, mitochondrial n=1 Tax=[Candida] jaroonii TaxID=467808 RepID=A0ACA9Y7G4_9ASCO|nr:54S ribosomal protein L39, mitochondrial [[Candida] jaroonii]